MRTPPAKGMQMFKYGRTNGIMAIALTVLSFIPLIELVVLLPQIPETVVIGFNAAADTARTGTRWHLVLLPLICLALGAASLLSAYRRSGADGASPAIAQLTFRRYVRSGLVAAVIFNVANIYLMAMALTGQSAPWLG